MSVAFGALQLAAGTFTQTQTCPVSLARMPLYFESIPVEAGQPERFLARGCEYQFRLGPDEADFVLQKCDRDPNQFPLNRHDLLANRHCSLWNVRMTLIGANGKASLRGEEPTAGTVNYFVGDDPSKWRVGGKMFTRVRVDGIYPGISLVYYGNQERLEYDFNLAPGADPGAIRMRFQGMDKLALAPTGDLVLSLGDDEIRHPRPRVYQVVNGLRREVAGTWTILESDTVGFAVPAFNRSSALVIDPEIDFSTYFGGSAKDTATAVRVGKDGSIYIAGETLSLATTFPSTLRPNGYSTRFHGGTASGDAFVAKFAKFDGILTTLLYFTYLGGTANDAALDLAVDADGNAYVTGFTDSVDFPRTVGVIGVQNRIGGVPDPSVTVADVFPTDAFVTKFDATGTRLLFSTYLGGSLNDTGIGIAVDETANVYVAGLTFSTNFPVTTGAANRGYKLRKNGTGDCFLTKLRAEKGSALLYSTYFGGTNNDAIQGVAVSNDLAFVTGYTYSGNFPVTTNALQPEINRGTKARALDAFVAEFDTAKSGADSLVYSSYLGGTNHDAGYRIALDGQGNVYVTGDSASPDFPDTTNHVEFPATGEHVAIARGTQGKNAFNYDVFLAEFHADNGQFSAVASFLFGGSKDDIGWDIAVGPDRNIHITGVTASTNFPSTGQTDLTDQGYLGSSKGANHDAFITVFKPDATDLFYSAYVGGNANDFAFGVAVDDQTNTYVKGQTFSGNFPFLTNALGSSPNSLRRTRIAGGDAYLLRIEP